MTKAVDETSQSAGAMLQVSRDLSQQADQQRNTVETFLSEVSSTEKAMKEVS